MRISVFESRELQAVTVSMKTFDREVSKQIRAQTKRVVQPAWQDAVRANVTSRLEARVLADTARAAVSNQNVLLQSARIGRSLSGGGTPARLVGGAEFGANRNHVSGRRHTQRQFKTRRKTGYVVYPAAAEVIPRIASLWVQTVVRTFYELIEKR